MISTTYADAATGFESQKRLLQDTLSYLGFGAGQMSPHTTETTLYVSAKTITGQHRTPAKHFADIAPGSGPGLADPISFSVLQQERLRTVWILPNTELGVRGSNTLAFAIPAHSQTLLATPQDRQGIHPDLLHNGDAASAGLTRLEWLLTASQGTDLRFATFDSGHYRPYGAPTLHTTQSVLQNQGFDAEGRVISTFRAPGNVVNTEPFPTLTLRRTAQADGSTLIETYIPKRKDPNPAQPKSIPHFRALYRTSEPGVVHVTGLELGDFPTGYLAAFLAQSLKAHGIHPTQKLQLDGLYAYRLHDHAQVNLQQQVVAALDALGIRTTAVRFEPIAATGGAQVNLVVQTQAATNAQMSPDEIRALSSALPHRASVNAEFQPLQLPQKQGGLFDVNNFIRDLFELEDMGGSTNVWLNHMDHPTRLISVDYLGTLVSHLPKVTEPRHIQTQKELLSAAGQLLNEQAVQVNTIRLALNFGSSDSRATLFMDRVRHYHHSENLSLRQALHAAATDLVKSSHLTAGFGFAHVGHVHVANNLILIEAKREPASVPPIDLPTNRTTPQADTGFRRTPNDEALKALQAHLGPPPDHINTIRARSPNHTGADQSPQPDRSPEIPVITTLSQLLKAKKKLAPGKQGVWIEGPWTDEQLMRLAEKLDAEVALTRVDGRLRLTSGTRDEVEVLPPMRYQTATLLRHVHFKNRQPGPHDLKTVHFFHEKTSQQRPNARIEPSAVITRDENGKIKLTYFGPQRPVGKAPTYSARDLGLSASPQVSVQLRINGSEQATIRIAGLSGEPQVTEIRQAVHQLAQQNGIRVIRFEWDMHEATTSTRAAIEANYAITKEPHYDFIFGKYTEGELITWRESTDHPGTPYIESTPIPVSQQWNKNNTHAEKKRVERNLFKALTSGELKRFELLVDYLGAPDQSVNALAQRYDTQQVQTQLTHLVEHLIQSPTRLTFADVRPRMSEFLRPALEPGQTPLAYLQNILQDPGHWARSRKLIGIEHTRLTHLDARELTFLQELANHQFSVDTLKHALHIHKDRWYRATSAHARELLHVLNPQAHNWRALGLSYPGGLEQLTQDINQEIAHRATGNVRAVNFSALWRDAHQTGQHLLAYSAPPVGWRWVWGTPNEVSANIGPLSLQTLVHAHPQGATNPNVRLPNILDTRALERINTARAQWLQSQQKPAVMARRRIGPREHHVTYFGIPENHLPLTARLLNELGRSRQRISQAITSTPTQHIQLENLQNLQDVWVRTFGGTAVIRLGQMSQHNLAQALSKIQAWAQSQPQLHTLRIESSAQSKSNLQAHLDHAVAERAHFTDEDYYNFQSGQYNLNQTLSVARISMNANLRSADAQAYKLQDLERDYALQTLYFVGNKAYGRAPFPGSVNLSYFLPTKPDTSDFSSLGSETIAGAPQIGAINITLGSEAP